LHEKVSENNVPDLPDGSGLKISQKVGVKKFKNKNKSFSE
jgi:hypothetical protein